MKCNILHAALCFSVFLALSFPLHSQQPGSTLPQPAPPSPEKRKAQEEVNKAQVELDRANAKLEKIQNKENNGKLLKSLEEGHKDALRKGDFQRAKLMEHLIQEIKMRLQKDPSQDTGKLLDESFSSVEKKSGPIPPPLKDYTKADIIKRAKLDIKPKGTGKTTGRIGNMKVSNVSDEPFTFSMPVMEIPSDAGFQGYIVEETDPVTIPPGTTVDIPLDGYCTDVFSKPVPDGYDFPPFETWTVNTPMIETYYTAVETTTTIQETGEYTTPFTGDSTKEITTVVQYIIWLTDSPTGIYTFEDICIDVMQQIETTTGRPVSTFTPGEYYTFRDGLNDIIEMINEVGVTASIPSFIPSINIPEEFRPEAFPTPSDTGIEYTVTATGTGRTTGHIANITFTNPGDSATTIQIGSGTGLFIPSSGQYQPYIIPSLTSVSIDPGQTIIVPADGYCVDIHLPPVPSGDGMPGISDWYSVPPSTGTDTTSDVVTIPTNVTFTTDLARDILINNQPLVWSSLGEDCIPAVHQTTSTIPGTSKPIPGGEDGLFSTTQNPDVIVPIMLDAINRISIAYDEMKKENLITTPFSGNPEKEREAVIQQTFWRFTAGPEGKKYEEKNFQDNTIRQYEQNTGKDFESMPEAQKDKINEGADDFWDTFEAVGVEAKVLDVPPVLPDEPTTPPQDVWEDYDVGDTKATSANDDPPAVMPMPDDNVMVSTDAGEPHCKCGKISFTLDLGIDNGSHQMSSDQSKKEIEVGYLKGIIGVTDSTKFSFSGEFKIKDIDVSCECSSTGKCNFFPRHSQFAESDEGKATVTSSDFHVYLSSSTFALYNKKRGINSGLKFKIHAWCKGDSCKETKDCFETFEITLKQKK